MNSSCDEREGLGDRDTKEPVVGEMSGSLDAEDKTGKEWGYLVALKLATAQE